MALIVWFSNKLIFNEIVFFIYALRIYAIPGRCTNLYDKHIHA